MSDAGVELDDAGVELNDTESHDLWSLFNASKSFEQSEHHSSKNQKPLEHQKQLSTPTCSKCCIPFLRNGKQCFYCSERRLSQDPEKVLSNRLFKNWYNSNLTIQNTFKAERNNKFSHTLIGQFRGLGRVLASKMMVQDADLDLFYKVLLLSSIVSGKPFPINEVGHPDAPRFFVDLDFAVDINAQQRREVVFRKFQSAEFYKDLADWFRRIILQKYFVKKTNTYRCIVAASRFRHKKDSIYKIGFHLVFPNIFLSVEDMSLLAVRHGNELSNWCQQYGQLEAEEFASSDIWDNAPYKKNNGNNSSGNLRTCFTCKMDFVKGTEDRERGHVFSMGSMYLPVYDDGEDEMKFDFAEGLESFDQKKPEEQKDYVDKCTKYLVDCSLRKSGDLSEMKEELTELREHRFPKSRDNYQEFDDIISHEENKALRTIWSLIKYGGGRTEWTKLGGATFKHSGNGTYIVIPNHIQNVENYCMIKGQSHDGTKISFRIKESGIFQHCWKKSCHDRPHRIEFFNPERRQTYQKARKALFGSNPSDDTLRDVKWPSLKKYIMNVPNGFHWINKIHSVVSPRLDSYEYKERIQKRKSSYSASSRSKRRKV